MKLDKRIFLGGTVGNNTWRVAVMIPGLLSKGIPEQAIFNPVVSHWDKAAQEREDQAKRDEHCLLLFVIASPDPTGEATAVSGYSLVEMVMALYDAPERTIVVFDLSQMARKPAKGMKKAADDLKERFPQAPIFFTYEQAIEWLAEQFK
jgi:hypothetical protein